MPNPAYTIDAIVACCQKSYLSVSYYPYRCCCPQCCSERAETAVYLPQDFEMGKFPRGWWGRIVTTEKLARMCPERIIPGWPGCIPSTLQERK